MVFDPYDLSIDVTPEGVTKAIAESKFSEAVMMSFRLNERELIVRSVEAVPVQDSECVQGSTWSVFYYNVWWNVNQIMMVQ